MQQFILIPEVPAIVRKIADHGEHWAFFAKEDRQLAEDSYRSLLNKQITELNYTWTNFDFHRQGREYTLKFLPTETSNG
jgi:hypothetical protein